MAATFKAWITKYSRSHVLSLICLTVAIVLAFMNNPAYVEFLYAAVGTHVSSKISQYIGIMKQPKA